jgi:uncharacterized protein DUF2637
MWHARTFRPGALHASIIISCVVAAKSFAMSYAVLHNLAIRNFVPPDLASNIPVAIGGLTVGSVLATAFFRRRSAGWWYATGLFVLSTLVSVAGNTEYAREIGGDYVAVVIHAGMPLITMFAAHLTLLLWNNHKQESNGIEPAIDREHDEESAEVDPFMHSIAQHLRSIDSPPFEPAANNLVRFGGHD